MRRYEDALDLIWTRTAGRIGITVERDAEVYASWDGATTLRLATPAEFDPDDSLAQMILHEICHALVEGERGLTRRDWGLENIDDRDLVREHACHRVQAALADRHGLRHFFEVTTQWRPYYAGLPADPMADGDDPAIELAKAGFERAVHGEWAPALEAALAATAAIWAVVRAFGVTGPPTIWDEDREPPGERR